MAEKERKLGIWGKYLTLWVALCIGAGIGLGRLFPGLSDILAKLEVANISIPIALLLFAMIYPIMVQISWEEIKNALKSPKPIGLTLFANWAVKPFTMALFAWLFLGVIFKGSLTPEQIEQYRAGTILLGVAPCTAMVLVWSYLAKGNMGHTLVMTAINSLSMVVLYAPLAVLLLGISGISGDLLFETIQKANISSCSANLTALLAELPIPSSSPRIIAMALGELPPKPW